MPVDQQLKADLMLVKDAFEKKALQQDVEAAALVPMAPMLRAGRDAHQSIRDQVTRYPSYYARNTDRNKSTLDRIQQECVPCAARISSLKDCDLSPDIDETLLVYNRNVLQQLTAQFNTLNGRNPIETHLCDIYNAFKSECLPDIRRAIAALAFLLNDIRGFKLKDLKDSFLQTLLALIAGLVVNITFNFEKFGLLVTDTLKCVLADIKAQLAKLSPILSEEGRDKAKEAVTRAWRSNEDDKQWLQGTDLYAPAAPSEVPFNNGLTAFEQQTLDKIPSLLGGVDEILERTLQEAITKIDLNIIGTRQELLKLLKQNGEDMKALHQLIEQILLVQGMLNVLRGIADAKGDYNPCGDPDVDNNEQARRFFTRLKLPNRRIQVNQDDNGDVEIEVIPDPTVVENPVVRDILQEAGFPIEGDRVLVGGEPVTINVFGCIGGRPE